MKLIHGAATFLSLVSCLPAAADKPWPRHIIDDSSRGADGVRLADVNGDGLRDITTGWEEGGITRVYLHPGHDKVRDAWPVVTVGNTPSVEDAVFCDLDHDGAVDVVSSCEGKSRRVFVHWAPKDPGCYLDSGEWETKEIPATVEITSWMFALPLQIDGKHGVDLVVGSKGKGAMVGWLEAPATPRNLAGWKLHKLYDAGWIMSLVAADVDDDGDADIVVSDRKGGSSGVLWLEHPTAAKLTEPWPEHRIGACGREAMFLDAGSLEDRGMIFAAARPDQLHLFARPSDPRALWNGRELTVADPRGIGAAKGVRAGDIDGDGEADLVYSCGLAKPRKRGVVWLPMPGGDSPGRVHDISGPDGTKFDRVELLDLDGDDDLDVLTCEERHDGRGLGVIWYENP